MKHLRARTKLLTHFQCRFHAIRRRFGHDEPQGSFENPARRELIKSTVSTSVSLISVLVRQSQVRGRVRYWPPGRIPSASHPSSNMRRRGLAPTRHSRHRLHDAMTGKPARDIDVFHTAAPTSDDGVLVEFIPFVMTGLSAQDGTLPMLVPDAPRPARLRSRTNRVHSSTKTDQRTNQAYRP